MVARRTQESIEPVLQAAVYAPLFAESPTEFFLKVVDAEIEFFKDDKGIVSHLMLHQGAADIKAPPKYSARECAAVRSMAPPAFSIQRRQLELPADDN